MVKLKLGNGSDSKTFEVPLAILEKGSSVLLQEESSEFIDLSNHDPASFESYLAWLHSDQIEKTTSTLQDWDETARAYALGEKIQDRRFQDYMITLQIRDLGTILPSLDCVMFVYNYLPQGSPLRKLAVNNWIVCKYPKFVDEDFHTQCHPEFLSDLEHTYKARTRPVSFDDMAWNRKEICKYLFKSIESKSSEHIGHS